MAQLTCPHCQSIFQLALSAPADKFTCPDCGGTVISPTAPPVRKVSAHQEPPLPDNPAPMQVIAVEPVAPPLAADLLPPPEMKQPEVVAQAPLATVAPAIDSPDEERNWNRRASRHYSLEERLSKRFVKNIIVWVVCAIVLVLLMLFFLNR